VLHLDLSEFQKLSAEINAVGKNINQIAKVVNATGGIFGNEMIELKARVEEIWQLQKSFLSELLSKIR
jgi:RNA binding exosome subunit